MSRYQQKQTVFKNKNKFENRPTACWIYRYLLSSEWHPDPRKSSCDNRVCCDTYMNDMKYNFLTCHSKQCCTPIKYYAIIIIISQRCDMGFFKKAGTKGMDEKIKTLPIKYQTFSKYSNKRTTLMFIKLDRNHIFWV